MFCWHWNPGGKDDTNLFPTNGAQFPLQGHLSQSLTGSHLDGSCDETLGGKPVTNFIRDNFDGGNTRIVCIAFVDAVVQVIDIVGNTDEMSTKYPWTIKIEIPTKSPNTCESGPYLERPELFQHMKPSL